MITKFNEYIKESKFYNETLNPKFWDEDKKFNQRIRGKLLSIAFNFYESLGLKARVQDIQLTGSLANYNYTDFSDLDVHILIDFTEVNKDVELVKSMVDNQRMLWNLKHDITIKGYEMELYIQDITEQHTASGLYSLMNGEWIVEPKYNVPVIDEKDVQVKTLNFSNTIDELERLTNGDLKLSEIDEYYNFAKKLKEKIHNGRKEGLKTKDAEFSVENLVFKELRNNGRFGKLLDIINSLYDKQYIQ